MRTNCYFKLLILGMLLGQSVHAGNPLIKGVGMSDPHIRVFNDTLYLFSGHDSSPEDPTWIMRDWRVFSSTDLVNWKLATTISPANNYMGAGSTDCWAGDAASRNGKYYFYFSDRKRGIGVMSSNKPGGHYSDALGRPLIAPMHDPTVFVDDDQNRTPYIVYGDKAGGGYCVVRLNPDMISLAETPKPVVIHGEEWKNSPEWMDKNYLFKYQGTYYLSWGRDYATSKNIYGPYQCAGAVANGHHLDEYAHGSFFWWKGQFYHIWTYYLKTGFKYRECIITYCHIADDGQIVSDTDFLDKHFDTGVGQYDASWPEIQAEWYTEKSENIIKQGSGKTGFKLANIENGSWIKFANVDFGESQKRIFTVMLSDITGKGTIEIRRGSLTGSLLGTASVVPHTGKTFVSCKLKDIRGRQDIYLRFTGNGSKTFNLDYFRFEKGK